MVLSTSPKAFLLSPARCGGRRAAVLLNPGSSFDLAVRLRAGALTLGEAFCFLSGLYCRGKLAYARRYTEVGRGDTTLVITPTRGLVGPDAAVTVDDLVEFAAVDVHETQPRYRSPLDRDLRALDAALPASARIILLGSIATPKYVQPATCVFGARLHFPVSFIGRGDMSRGGLLLRSVAAGEELAYERLDPEQPRRGARPPKLEPTGHAARARAAGAAPGAATGEPESDGR
jgi:hypothetical protein